MSSAAKNAAWKGTVHKDASTYPMWKQEMDEDLWSRELMGFVTGAKRQPAALTQGELDATADAAVAAAEKKQDKINEYKRDEMCCNKLLRSSLDLKKKIDVMSKTTPKEIYDFINADYGNTGPTRLSQLMRKICEVPMMKNSSVGDKYAILVNTNSEIKSSHKEMHYNDVQLAMFLQLSMSDEYSVEIRSLEKHATVRKPLNLDTLKHALEDLELALNDVHEVAAEELNFAGKNGVDDRNRCRFCKQTGHWKRACPKFLASKEGKAWAKTPVGITSIKNEKEYQARRAGYKRKPIEEDDEEINAAVEDLEDSGSDSGSDSNEEVHICPERPIRDTVHFEMNLQRREWLEMLQVHSKIPRPLLARNVRAGWYIANKKWKAILSIRANALKLAFFLPIVGHLGLLMAWLATKMLLKVLKATKDWRTFSVQEFVQCPSVSLNLEPGAEVEVESDVPPDPPEEEERARNQADKEEDKEIVMPANMTRNPSRFPKQKDTGWLLDSAASRHITNRKDMFVGKLSPSTLSLEAANKGIMLARGMGTVRTDCVGGDGQPKTILIDDVHYIPEASRNLISLGLLGEKGILYNSHGPGGKHMRVHRDGKTLFVGILGKNHVYHLAQLNYSPKPRNTIINVAVKRSKTNLLHARLGHPGESATERFPSVMDGLRDKNDKSKLKVRFCERCLEAKMTRKVGREPMTIPKHKLGIVDMDLCGPMPDVSLRGNKYMLTITDRNTGRKWVYNRPNKKALVDVIKAWRIDAEAECLRYGNGELLQEIHCDRGGEFISNAMQTWAKDNKITIAPTVGYHPEGNGIAERANRTILEKANANRFDAGLGGEYWDFAAETSCYQLNRGPMKGKPMSAWEAWFGTRPSVHKMRAFGAPAYVYIPKVKRTKHSKRPWKGIFVGYSTKTEDIYRIWDPEMRLMHNEVFVFFDERRSREKLIKALKKINYNVEADDEEMEDHDSESEEEDDYVVDQENTQIQDVGSGSEPDSLQDESVNRDDGGNQDGGDQDQDDLPRDDSKPQKENGVRGASEREETGNLSDPPTDLEDSFSIEVDAGPAAAPRKKRRTKAQKIEDTKRENAQRRTVEEARGDRRSVRQREMLNATVERILQPHLKAHGIFIPRTYKEAMECEDSAKWEEALMEEINSLKQHGTCSAEISEPKGGETVDCKIVWDVKPGVYDKSTKTTGPWRYKARIVARGFSQRYNINYKETFAPTLRYDALRILLAVASRNNWKIYQMDVKTAFLAGVLEETVFMEFPPHLARHFGKYVRLQKSLYGLKQAARVWYLLLEGFLRSEGFVPLPTDPSLFTKGEAMVSVGAYVDDLIITGPAEEDIDKLKAALHQRFDMKDMDEVRTILGMRVQRFGSILTLDQSRYAAEIIDKHYYKSSEVYTTPMDANAVNLLHETPGEELNAKEKTAYLKVVGKLMFLCNTRMDITFAVHKCAQYSASPSKNHWKAVLRILGYVKGTLNHGLVYGARVEKLRGVQDLDYYSVDHNIEVHVGTSKAFDIRTFTDADYATDKSDRKSISGRVDMINGAAVSCCSTKQQSVAKSTAQSEYLALSDGAAHAIWIQNVVDILERRAEKGEGVALIFGDNRAAIQISKGVSNTSKIKHIDVAFHHILDEVKKGTVRTYWVPGTEQLADTFTKPLPRLAFELNKEKIGILDVEEVEKSFRSRSRLQRG